MASPLALATHALHRPRRSLRFLLLALTAHRQRKALAKLDDHLLRDIGMTREDANAEADLPFWDVPRHWKR